MAGKAKLAKAGKLLTRFLETIAEEKTELGSDDNMITKAEALARLIWKRALGYNELNPKTGAEKIIAPDKQLMNLIFERIEGRAHTAGVEADKKLTIGERVSEVGKKRIANAGGLDDVSTD